MNKTLYVVVTLVLCATFVIGAIPDTLNIHGKLLNNGGSPQTGTFSMNFSIYDVASGGANIYTQTQSVTTDENGIYTLILSGLTGVNFSQQTYLEIQVESDSPMQPRINITSTPSALAPEAGAGGSSLWSETGSDIYYDAGDVGIGIATPSTQLEVDSTTTETTLTLDNNAGIEDVMIQYRNNGALAWSICMDDSILGDELEFIRGGDCASADLMALTTDGLEFGAGRLYFDRTSVWSTSFSARGNNQFTITCNGCTISTIAHNLNGQPIWVVSDTTSATIQDGTGNLELAGDFIIDCEGDSMMLIYNDRVAKWIEISRSDNC